MACERKPVLTRISFALALCAFAFPTLAADGQPGAHFVENWDLDGDGVVSHDDIRERRGDVFHTFDADENGVLDAEEYAVFDEARENDMKDNAGPGKGLRRAAEGMTLSFNDTDGNGEVSRSEFLDNADEWMSLIDRNGDGGVTTADFGRQ